jgi:hypothetical protein
MLPVTINLRLWILEIYSQPVELPGGMGQLHRVRAPRGNLTHHPSVQAIKRGMNLKLI